MHVDIRAAPTQPNGTACVVTRRRFVSRRRRIGPWISRGRCLRRKTSRDTSRCRQNTWVSLKASSPNSSSCSSPMSTTHTCSFTRGDFWMPERQGMSDLTSYSVCVPGVPCKSWMPNPRSTVSLTVLRFHRDEKGQALLLDRGFAREWADRAGKLALNEVEMVHEDNIVTFASLSLFWYTQGSWRRSYIHKGIQITGHIPNCAKS